MKYVQLRLILPALFVIALVGGTATALASAALGAPPPSAPSAPSAPARPVIVDVEGDPADGFTLHYADGTSLSPPTDSEAAAECSEYDTRLARVRCRVEVRTWYRDLGDLQRSLAWVRAHE